ncbi:hypothetical protein [Arthrospira platensis]|uniref:hypothetical protein n=1 Tax=Limnospira platensis TaxID=118562 RepID=UPI002570D67E|nr:hypothetical protein [Arthrospira platensis]
MEFWERVRSLFLTMRVAGYIAYLSRLGGGGEPNTTISPLLGFTQPTTQSYRLKKTIIYVGTVYHSLMVGQAPVFVKRKN